MGAKKEGFRRRSKGGDFRKLNFSRLGGVLETSFGSTMLQEVGILPTLVYFQPQGLFGCFFFALRACLGWILGLLGMLPCFDYTHCLEFRTGFWLGNGGNLNSCSS